MDVKEKTASKKRLIDANALAEKAYWHGDHPTVDNPFAEGVDAVDMSDIDNAPTIEAEPVRHGRWIDKGEYAVCAECGGRSGTQYDGVELIPLMTQFCPNCGAKMDGGAN